MGADILSGDDGRDRVSYATRTAPVNVNLGSFWGGDGQSGEWDFVSSTVEEVVGGSGDDTPDRHERGQHLDRRSPATTRSTAATETTCSRAATASTSSTRATATTRCAAATLRRTPSSCGAGHGQHRRGRRRHVAADCERPAVAPDDAAVPPGAATLDRVPSSVRLTRKGYLRIQVTCPITAVNGCTGSITIEVLAVAKSLTAMSCRAAASGAAGAFSLKAGQTKVTKVKISRNGRRRVLAKKRAKCKVSVHTTNAGTKRVTVSKKITVKAPKKAKRSTEEPMILAGKARIALRAVQAVALLGLVGYAAQSSMQICGSGADPFFEQYVYTGLIFMAAGLCLTRAIVVPRERLAWLVLGAGLLAWAGGEVYYSVFYADLAEPPLPGVSDGLWLTFYPGLLRRDRAARARARAPVPDQPVARRARGRAGGLRDRGRARLRRRSSATGARTMWSRSTCRTRSETCCCSASWSESSALPAGGPGRALLLVGAGLVTSAVVDGFFLYESALELSVDSTLMATLWPASALLLGFAAWQRPTVAEPVRFEGARVLLMPAAFAVAGLAILGWHTIERQNALALALAIATLGAVIVRMSVTFRENIRLLASSRRDALTDALTGLGNRRALMEDLEVEVAVATSARPRGLVLLDLDGFKQYNDRFGHPMGDALLARLGQRLAEAFPHDRAYRLGGDEFCVLVRGTREDGAPRPPRTRARRSPSAARASRSDALPARP